MEKGFELRSLTSERAGLSTRESLPRGAALYSFLGGLEFTLLRNGKISTLTIISHPIQAGRHLCTPHNPMAPKRDGN